MVGRTPEYLGKKIEQYEMKMAALAILILPLSILVFTAIAIAIPAGVSAHRQPRAARAERDPLRLHLSTGNNGSAFAGLGEQHALLQLDRRLRDADRALRLHRAGAGARWLDGAQEASRRGPGTFPTNTPLFAGLLVGVILIVGALTYFPAYSPRPHRRAAADARWQDVLDTSGSVDSR